jgi:hypothetical protein
MSDAKCQKYLVRVRGACLMRARCSNTGVVVLSNFAKNQVNRDVEFKKCGSQKVATFARRKFNQGFNQVGVQRGTLYSTMICYAFL